MSRRRVSPSLVCVLLLLGAPPAGSTERAFQPEDLFRLRSASEVALSPDGTMLAYVERSTDRASNRNVSRIWLVSLKDGTSRPLSEPGAADHTPRWSPGGEALAYFSGAATVPGPGDGAEEAPGSSLVVVRMPDGEPEIVATYQTSNDPLAYQGVGNSLSWSPDGEALAYLSADPGPEPPPGDPIVIRRYTYKSWATMNDNRVWHVYTVTLADRKVRRLTSGAYHEHSISWSPGGEEIAFVTNPEEDADRVHNYDLFAVRVADGTVRRLTRTKGVEYSPVWSSDGESIAFRAGTRPLTTRESSAEDPHLWVMPSQGGAPRELAPGLDRRVMDVASAPDERSVYFTVQDHGSTILYRIGLDGGRPEPIVSGPGSVGSFSVGRSRAVAFAFEAVESPSEIYAKLGERSAVQVTRLNEELLAGREVSVPEPFEFASFDGTRVQGFLVPPLAREPDERYPVILRIHGGPHGQQGPGFDHKTQVYAGAGYAVVMVNYRGSSGYGQSFTDGTVGDQNGAEFRDVVAGLDFILEKTPYLDPDRLGVEGGSYGGQLTNWAITQTDRFKSAIPSSSISNLVSLGYTIWAQDYIQVEFGGHPWQNGIAELMWQRSPLAHVAKVTTPTMFLHGEEDQDVSIVEAEQMYIALKQVGVETVFVRYPREGHGLREPAHRLDALERSLAWHGRFLGPDPSGDATTGARR